MSIRGAVLSACLAALPAAAQAQEAYIGGYNALLGPEDRVNSRGVRLGNGAAIVRQDRANFHRFGIRHAEDRGDPWFDSPGNRQGMEALIQMSPTTESIILRHNAYVAVSLYGRQGRITRIVVEIPG